MTTTTITKATPADAGCWIDGHWGQYGVTRLVDIAIAHGWKATLDEARAIHAYQQQQDTFVAVDGERHDTADWMLNQGGIGDAIEDWMNENVAPEGFYFGWEDGEFFLSPVEDDEDEDPNAWNDDDGLSDVEADAMTLASAGMGTAEDYGDYGGDDPYDY